MSAVENSLQEAIVNFKQFMYYLQYQAKHLLRLIFIDMKSDSIYLKNNLLKVKTQPKRQPVIIIQLLSTFLN